MTTRQLAPTVIFENRAGAGGKIGLDALAQSAPDGYTLGVGALSTHAVIPSLYPKMPFDPVKDFTPISLLVVTPKVLVIKPSVLPAKDIPGIIDFAKKNPGKVNCASGSNGSVGHLASELFRLRTGAPIAPIPYKGGAPAVTDLLGGQVQMLFDNLANAMPPIKAGKTQAFAVNTPKRSALTPQLPTMAEAGFKDFDVYAWWGLFAPTGTPREIVTRLSSEVDKALANPDWRSQWLAGGASPRRQAPKAWPASSSESRPSTPASSRNPVPSSMDELRAWSQLLAEVREGQASTQQLVDMASPSHELLRALPPPFARALDQITMRLSSAAVFAGESCSFSQADLLLALEQWLVKARAKLESAG